LETEQIIRNNLQLLAQSDKHNQSSLAVTNIVDLPICNLCYIGESCWQIIHRHVVESEVPEIQRHSAHLMVAVSVASAVADPNIEPLVGQD